MALMYNPSFLPSTIFFFFLFSFSFTISSSYSINQRHLLQSNPPQNIQTFFPSGSSPAFSTSPPPPSISNLPEQTIPNSSPPPKNSSNNNVIKAVAATAATTIVLSALFFFFLQKYLTSRRPKPTENTVRTSHQDDSSATSIGFNRFDGALKGVIVDENGLDVLYWRKLEDGNRKSGVYKEILDRTNGIPHSKSNRVQEMPLLYLKSSNSSSHHVSPELPDPDHIISIREVPSPPPPPPPTPSPPPVATKAIPAAPPPPPPPAGVKKNPAPPPPPIGVKKNSAPPPPPPPIGVKKNPAPPPPPPRAGGSTSSLKPPTAPSSSSKGKSIGEENTTEKGGQAKLKPLHWDKVTAQAEHSMVWDKINGGSFRFDDDLMEALFGYVATNKKSTDGDNKNSSNPGHPKSSHPPTQICLLDPHKSQNIAIVLRSLTITRQEILDALLKGQGLSTDTLEKLTKIAPTQEEETMFLEFSGDPSKLADAESFLYHLLRTVPSPFKRLDTMLFKSTYDPEILHLKQSLQTLESACKELRTRGLFLKLLEAVLKAGNRMNAGTARGNAQAFNLAALRKLSDVKSTDGKTSLLHFVVEEVVRSEGKRCVINKNHTLSRSNSKSNSTVVVGKEEREKEYIMLGLPVVGGLSVEFSNVKKAATIDYDAFVGVCSTLTRLVSGIRQFLASQDAVTGREFVKEMKGFLEEAEEELKVVKEEEMRVMELVKRTYEYYQAGASKDKGSNPLQIFLIVKDFLGMVDQVCVDIARNQQRKKHSKANIGAQSTTSPVRFPYLPAHFMSDKSKISSSSSDSENDF
ncbi:formin-like protein 8 [Tasmannia lanceolata]|uniref:formin-like protein 8 n=1 Tax=Tasmannia lanceolata TaxID=3420 RepID=UPI0040630518